MLNFNRFGAMLLLVLVVALVVDSTSVFGQRATFRGRTKTSDDSGDNGQNRRNDDDDDEGDENNSSQSQNQSDGDDVQQQLQQFFQGGQGNPRSRRNRDDQGESSDNNRFQDGQQFQNLQQFQNQQHRQFQGDSNQHNRRRFTIDNWSVQFGNTNRPFSAKWYEQHPDAWHYDHEHSNAWVAVPSNGVASWLGWGQNIPGAIVVGPTGRPIERFDPNRYGDWLPLGVYLLMSSPDDNTRLLQLSVDRLGTLRGVYYDAITGTSHNVSGKMYRETQEARWSLRNNRQVKFRARLSDLLQPYGWVGITLPGGDQRWELVRLER